LFRRETPLLSLSVLVCIVVQEFELMSHESECMKRKLLSQEDEFRLQNETLMTELGQVSD